MRGSLILLLAAAGVAASLAAGQSEAPVTACSSTLLPADFSDRAYRHIVSVVARSPRPASSKGERKVTAYVRDQFQKMGLTTVVEEFEFGSYEIENMQLRLGGSTYRPVFVAFHPYAGVFQFEGLAHFIDPQDLSSRAQLPDLENGYVISAPPADFFRLMFQKPQLIVFLAPADFARQKATPDRRFDLTITGRPVRYKSANVTGVVAGSSGAQQEIIVSAHLDAYGSSPGASDNGSGLGVLIELARHFKSMEGRLRVRVKFVAFGAEELGVLGSRAYVLKHAAELQHCAFNLNIDDIGGPRCPIVETQGGVSGIPERAGVNLFPAELMEKAWQGLNGNWRLLDPRLFRALQASNHPDWLNASIVSSSQALGVKVVPSGTLGSDQLVFTQAGVVATGVGCPSDAAHSAADTSAGVRKENLRMVGQLAACIVGAAAPESAGQQPGREISGQYPDAVSGERIARTVAAISEGADSAQRRSAILRRLDELDVKYRTEDFCSGPACGINVLVEPDRPRAKTLMLGAHYDRASKGKGAVDDAAGVAAVLELLTAFKNKPLGNHGALTAALFDLEEAGMLGSKAYVAARQQRHDLPAFYLNFDIFAYGDTLWVMSNTGSSALAGVMRTAADQQKFALTMEDQAPPGDDRVFHEAGVEALGLGLVPQIELESIHRVVRGEEVTSRPSLMKIVHTEDDTPEKVKGEEIARALRVVEAAIRAIDAGW